MSHINYNHLYYPWYIYKEGSVVGAAEVLHLAPQTITRQIKVLGERLQGKLFKRKERGLEPSKLGELAFRYADKMFTLSREMLDIVNYRRESSLLFDVGITDALSEQLVNSVLDAAAVEDEQIHLRYFESTYKTLLDQLSQCKLDVIISDRPIDSTQQKGLFSVRIGKCNVSFQYTEPLPERPFPACLEERRLLIPGHRSMLGRKLLNWVSSQGLNIEILGESDDTALVKTPGVAHNVIFVAPTLYSHNFYADDSIVEIGRAGNIVEEYRAIFTERMIQHPAVQRICSVNYSALFKPQWTYLL